MPSLREKFQAEKTEAEATEASLREKLEAEKLKVEQDAKLQELRSQITILENQKKVLDEAVSALKEGYVSGASDLESFKKGKGEVQTSEKVLSEANIVIEKLRQDFPDVFQAKGITNKEELLNAPDYQEEAEIQGYKKAEATVGKAKEGKKTARDSLRATVGTLRTAKGKIEESAADVELSFRKKDRVGSMEKLNQFSLALNEEIERLKLQTPEGQEAAKEKFNSKFGERLKKYKFLTRQSWGYSTGLVRAEDIGDSQKYGQNLVEGTLRNQVEGKIKSEVEQEKERVGIITARQELETLKELPKKYETFLQKVRELAQKRENVIQNLTEKGSAPNLRLDSRIKYYFGREGGSEFGKMLNDDFARAWLLHTEKDYICEQFYGGKYNWHWEKKVAEGGVPAILSDFLDKKREVVRGLEEQGRRRSGRTSVRVSDLFDPSSFESDIKSYEQFLDTFEDIVQNQTESIAGDPRSHSTKSDLDILHEKLGYRTSDNRPFQPLNLKSQKVIEGLNASKSFDDIATQIKKAEEPFDRAYEERKEFLNRLIEKEWAEQELTTFENAHPAVRGIQEKAKKIKTQKLASQELTPILLKAKELILSGVSGSENVYNKFTVRLQKAYRESIDLTILHPDLENLRKKRETAEKELEKIRNKIADNKRTKRPRFSLGKSKLDQELEVLQTDEATKVSEFQNADETFKSVATLRANLGNNIYPMTKMLEKGRFDIGNKTLSVSEFLDSVQKFIDGSSSASLSPEEEKVFGEYSKFQQNVLTKRGSYEKKQDRFSDEVVQQLQKVGWMESRS